MTPLKPFPKRLIEEFEKSDYDKLKAQFMRSFLEVMVEKFSKAHSTWKRDDAEYKIRKINLVLKQAIYSMSASDSNYNKVMRTAKDKLKALFNEMGDAPPVPLHDSSSSDVQKQSEEQSDGDKR